MTVTAEDLSRAGIMLDPEEFEALVLEVASSLPSAIEPESPRRELTQEEVGALERGGVSVDVSEPGEDPLELAAAKYTALLAQSLTVSEAAKMLGVNPSRVRQRLAGRTLYGIRQRSGWRLPAFQFERGRPLPGIELVLPRLDTTLHPLSVYNWFTSPDPDLVIGPDELPVSPRDWLLSGGDPSVVAEIAASL